MIVCWITLAFGIEQVYSAAIAAAVGPTGAQQSVVQKKACHGRRKRHTKKSPWLNRRRCRLKNRRALRHALLHRKHSTQPKVDNTQTIGALFWPLERGKFWKSSLFGYRRNDAGVSQFHTGLDLAAPKHTPVHAAADGQVVEARFDAGYGNMILLQHGNGVKTRYAHLHRIKIRPHHQVKKGQLIGTVGATGNVRGNGTDKSHLHFEVLIGGQPCNPLRYLR